MMRQWIPTPEEMATDWYRANILSRHLKPVECNARIAYHDATQEALKIIIPAPRFMAALMHGGFIRMQRNVEDVDGRPVLEGTRAIMGPMTYAEAVAFVAWKDMPRGVNHYEIITTDDLPRISGSADKARKQRAAWRLLEAA